MGNWSPYSEEWEKQHLKKLMEESDATRREFERKPRIYKAIVRLWQTIMYYGELLAMQIRMAFDPKYRKEVRQAVDGLEEKTLKAIVDIVNEDRKDDAEQRY